jgi:preprotein translocase SecF subunit
MNKKISFSKYSIFFIPLSILLILSGWIITYTLLGGFNYGIDFAGGIKLRFYIPTKSKISTDDLKRIVSSKLGIQPTTQRIGKENSFMLIAKFNFREEKKYNLQNKNNVVEENPLVKGIKEAIYTSYNNVKWLETKYVGPTIGEKYRKEAITISIFALLSILVYVAWRFQLRFAVAAVITLFHDSLITLSFLGITRIELAIPIVAAILTIIGYSLNDTIVIFDRIRENMQVFKTMKLSDIIDLSITQSLSRTLITSITTALAIVSLLYAGVVVGMNITLLFGIIVGTYSSIYIASPIIIFWDKLKRIKRKTKKR